MEPVTSVNKSPGRQFEVETFRYKIFRPKIHEMAEQGHRLRSANILKQPV